MGKFKVSIVIQVPITAVWSRLADIGAISEWNPGVKNSFKTNDRSGLGATRHCDLRGSNALEEEVVRFEPNSAITFRITETNTPFQTADIHFTLESCGNDATEVTVSPIYKLKYGLFGQILDFVTVLKTYKHGMNKLLEGLKIDLETNK
jgi:uncharacterized protein YndB with AHSA1/START domain